jgi:hypothetical protein
MWRLRARLLGILMLLAMPAPLFAVGEKADAIVLVADSRNASGLRAWWMNLYNESHLLFALITIIILPVTGLILGKLTGAAMARLGINLKARELAEH